MIKVLSYEEFNSILDMYKSNISTQTLQNFLPLLNKVIDNELTAKQKQCFIYHFRYNKRVKDIAKILNVSCPTVSIHLKRAKSKLYNSLKYYICPKSTF